MKRTNAYSFLKHYKKEMILGPIFKMLEVVFELLTPFVLSYIIDTGILKAVNDSDYMHIIIPSLIIVGFCLLGFLSTLVCQYFASVASQGYGTKLRDALYKKIVGLSYNEVEKIGKGNLNNTIINDSVRLQTSVAMMVRLVLRAPAIVLGSLFCSFIINYKIGFLFLGLVAVISLIVFIIIKVSTKRILKAQDQMDEVSSFVSDNINGIRYIKAYNLSDEENEKFEEKTENYRKKMNGVNFLNALSNPLTLVAINIFLVLIIYFSVGQIIPTNSEFTKGNLASLIQYLNQISIALVVVLNLIVIFNKAFASKRRVEEVLNLGNSVKEIENPIDAKTLKNEKIFEFCGVFYEYNADFPILKDINFEILRGQKVGFIGGTGSGKSTISKLLRREFDASKGTILYKGEDIKNLSISSLRNEISQVFQKVSLFKGTIKSNFLLINNKATDEDIIEALKKAKAYDFVKQYDDFLDHEVLEDGKNFSGGQRQRLNIALGLIKKTPILILDEASSALDSLTSKELNANLKEMNTEATIVISQKINSLSFCDKIFVIDNGSIIASGTHEELLRNCAQYKEIYEVQNS